MSSSDTLAVSKSPVDSAVSTCCIATRNDIHVPCPSVTVSTVDLQPTLDGITSECDSLAVDGIIQSNVISSACECILENCCSVARHEASVKTSSNTEMSCDTVIACSASYCML